MHILKDYKYINSALTELVGHTVGSFPYAQSKITTSGKYYMPSHSTVSLHKSTTATWISQRHFFLQDERMRTSEQ